MEWSWREERDRVVVTRGPVWAVPHRFTDLAEAERFVHRAIGTPDGRQALLRAMGAPRPDLGGPALGQTGHEDRGPRGVGWPDSSLAAPMAWRLFHSGIAVWEISEAERTPLPVGIEDAEPPSAPAGRGAPAADSAPANESGQVAMLVEAARTGVPFCQECADQAARQARRA